MHTIATRLSGRRIWLVIAAGAMFVSACNTDQFLKATDPDNTPPGALKGASSFPAIAPARSATSALHSMEMR